MVLVSMVGSTQRDELAHTIDAGPDDLMMRPFSRDVFVRRMNELAARRKKFRGHFRICGPDLALRITK
jgi:DNA-binding response OmpR family regulator